ncbi:MAG: hypothetical protein Aurels2KO_25420 [Aureliella sp.]
MRSSQGKDQAQRRRERLRSTLAELLSDIEHVDPRAIRYRPAEHPVEHIAEQLKRRRMIAITPAFAHHLLKALSDGT